MKTKAVLVACCAVLLLSALAGGVSKVKAQSSGSMAFAGGVTVYSPVDTTYATNLLTLDVHCDEGVPCTLSYSIDGTYEGTIPMAYVNTTEALFISDYAGTVQLPWLSEGSHCLTITEEANLDGYEGANPPGAPFQQASPGSNDYYACWVDQISFSIGTNMTDQQSTPLLPPTISDLSVLNQTYTTRNIPLNFTIDQNASKIAYRLDGNNNVTISGNTTLTGLPVGGHSLTVYAWDNDGNVGASQTVNFTVASMSSAVTTSPASFRLIVVIGLAVALAVLIIGCLMLFKGGNAKHPPEKRPAIS